MKLNEKIFYCRKKAGLSQEALAEKIGVSRQAVSKWETAEAEPEISKLRLLAAEFGVGIDWLLSEDEPPEQEPAAKAETGDSAALLNHLPWMLGRLARRFGWLAGIYISFIGAGSLIFGIICRLMISIPLRHMAGDPLWENTVSDILAGNPIIMLGNIMIIIGGIIILAGIALAIFLKKKLNR